MLDYVRIIIFCIIIIIIIIIIKGETVASIRLFHEIAILYLLFYVGVANCANTAHCCVVFFAQIIQDIST